MGPEQNFNTKAFDYYPELNRVRRHFETNHSEPMSLSDAAKIAGLEAKHFGKFFSQKVGIGFKQWSTLIRIQKAINLMRKEHRPLIDIAFANGFQDYGTFERAFKKHTGITPSEFKKNLPDVTGPDTLSIITKFADKFTLFAETAWKIKS